MPLHHTKFIAMLPAVLLALAGAAAMPGSSMAEQRSLRFAVGVTVLPAGAAGKAVTPPRQTRAGPRTQHIPRLSDARRAFLRRTTPPPVVSLTYR